MIKKFQEVDYIFGGIRRDWRGKKEGWRIKEKFLVIVRDDEIIIYIDSCQN